MTNTAYQLGHVQVEDDGSLPMDEALNIACKKLGIGLTLSGGSGWGWSRYSTLQQCAYKYNLKYNKKLKSVRAKPKALEIGGCFHAFMATYYQRQIDLEAHAENPTPEVGVLFDELLELNASAINVNEAWRLFDGYANYWEGTGDIFSPIAVELRAADPKEPLTCRYDLLAHVEEGHTVLPGTYIVEHKTSSRMETESWHLDGEILGQIAVYQSAGLHKKYGPLRGVIINLIVKTKIPQFHREIVVPPTGHMKRQKRDLRVHRAQLAVYESTGTWPRSLSACMNRFTPCEFFEHCRNG